MGRWAVVGVLAGAIGNCIDRVLYGYVVDMFKPVFLRGHALRRHLQRRGYVHLLLRHPLLHLHPLQPRVQDAEAGRRGGGGGEARAPGEPAAAPTRAAATQRAPGSSRRVPAREAAKANVRARRQAAARPGERTRIPVQQPRPQRRPAQAARSAIPVDPANPFAEWENAPKAAPEKEEGYAYYLTPNYDPEPAAKPDAAAGAAKARPEAGHEFTLEEILAEFSDK